MNHKQISQDLLAAIAKIRSLNLEDKARVRRHLEKSLEDAGFAYPNDAAAELVPFVGPLNMASVQSIAHTIAQGSSAIDHAFANLLIMKMLEI